MKTGLLCFAPALTGAVLIGVGLTNHFLGTVGARADGPKTAAPQVVLAETYNAVTKIYFTNVAVHKGSHKPGLVERRFRADVKYWLLDAKYYERGELSVGNPPLVNLVRKLGSKNLPESAAVARRDLPRDCLPIRPCPPAPWRNGPNEFRSF
jgi:hypothetical protein